jgi:hypothetical protein
MFCLLLTSLFMSMIYGFLLARGATWHVAEVIFLKCWYLGELIP